MKLENKYSTVEQSRRLKELGVIQGKSERYWYVGDTGNNIDHLNITGANDTDHDLCHSAFDSSELGVMLPEEQAYKFFSTFYNDHSGNWEVEYRGFKTDDELEDWNSIEPPPKIYETEGDTEAQARAEMIIWLLENKIVSPGEINQRLQNS